MYLNAPILIGDTILLVTGLSKFIFRVITEKVSFSSNFEQVFSSSCSIPPPSFLRKRPIQIQLHLIPGVFNPIWFQSLVQQPCMGVKFTTSHCWWCFPMFFPFAELGGRGLNVTHPARGPSVWHLCSNGRFSWYFFCFVSKLHFSIQYLKVPFNHDLEKSPA